MSGCEQEKVLSLQAWYNIFGPPDAASTQQLISTIQDDCKVAFDVRSINSNQENYSVGSTYAIKPSEKALCSLEYLAQQIFNFHTKGLKDVQIDPQTSCAEWWTQVIDSRDDIGMHWDRDYGAEEEKGQHIYPYKGTVTYLSNCGGPTIVIDREGTADNTTDIVGRANRISISKPLLGKSIAFRGNLLHAAPASLENTDDESDSECEDSRSGSESESDDASGDDVSTVRITLLVNIWINHMPSQAVRFPKTKLRKMSKLQIEQFDNVSFSNGRGNEELNIKLDSSSCERTKKWRFNNSDINYVVEVPLPSLENTIFHLKKSDIIRYSYDEQFESDSSLKTANICIRHSKVQYASDSDSDDSEDDSVDGSKESGSKSSENLDQNNSSRNMKKQRLN